MSTFRIRSSVLHLGIFASVLISVFFALVVYLSLPHTAYAVITSVSQLSNGCLTNPSTCNAEENAFLDSQQAVQNSAPNNQGQAAQLINQGANAANTAVPYAPGRPGTCSTIIGCLMELPARLWGAFMTVLTGLLIEISRWFLIIAGLLFNWLIDRTIIQFGALYGTIKPAVETAWTAFRDIANILIIGIFTFVAIGTILGLQNYNAKKMVAKVLIIAVLINFSLLFTKMIIDASNYTAAQIYTAAALGGSTGAQGGSVSAGTSGASYGIATQFMNLLGVSTSGDAFKVVDKVANAEGGWWAAPLHGILVMLVVLGAAMVLFYGCFLLISRMIMLIFLMGTASIAFATYLIPEWSGTKFGWSAWWSSLIWCATFGPILMILLWVTLNVSYALRSAQDAKVTLGAALSSPTSGNIEALFSYVVILGLLFGSFKIASMWASKIGGFNYAQMATALPFTLGSRIAGLGLRLGVGAPAYFRSKSLVASAKEDRDLAGRARRKEEAALNRGQASRAALFGRAATQWEQRAAEKAGRAASDDKLAERRFNLMDTGLAKKTLKGLGVTGFAAGESGKGFYEKSYSDQVKTRAEAGEKVAAKLAPGKGDEEKTRLRVNEERRARREQTEALRNMEKSNAEAVKQFQQLPQKLAEAQQNLDYVRNDAGEEKMKIAADRTMTQAAQKSAMDTQDSRIAAAQENIGTIQRGIDALDQPWKDRDRELEKYDEGTKKIADELVAFAGKAAEEIAGQVGAKQGDALKRLYGSLPLPKTQNQAVKDAMLDKYKGNRDTAKWRKIFESMKDDASPPTSTPPAGTP